MRERFCPNCHRSAGLHVEGRPLPNCPRCGAPTRLVSSWSDSDASEFADDALPDLDSHELQEQEIAHSPLTWRQRCGQRLTDGG